MGSRAGGQADATRRSNRVSFVRYFWMGAAAAVAATFPLAALVALAFRFPIPFVTYMSGVDAIIPALFAAAFYGTIGGFVVQALAGGVAGYLAAWRAEAGRKQAWRRCLVWA